MRSSQYDCWLCTWNFQYNIAGYVQRTLLADCVDGVMDYNCVAGCEKLNIARQKCT